MMKGSVLGFFFWLFHWYQKEYWAENQDGIGLSFMLRWAVKMPSLWNQEETAQGAT